MISISYPNFRRTLTYSTLRRPPSRGTLIKTSFPDRSAEVLNHMMLQLETFIISWSRWETQLLAVSCTMSSVGGLRAAASTSCTSEFIVRLSIETQTWRRKKSWGRSRIFMVTSWCFMSCHDFSWFFLMFAMVWSIFSILTSKSQDLAKHRSSTFNMRGCIMSDQPKRNFTS